MSGPPSEARYTVEEYLASERESEERHEYLDGQIHLMVGESPEHGAICMNLSRIVSTQLLRTPCQAFSKDTKVRSGASSISRLVWQSAAIVEHYVRQPDDSWSIYVYQGLEDSVFIKSINSTLLLAEVYDRVVFPVEAENETAEEQ